VFDPGELAQRGHRFADGQGACAHGGGDDLVVGLAAEPGWLDGLGGVGGFEVGGVGQQPVGGGGAGGGVHDAAALGLLDLADPGAVGLDAEVVQGGGDVGEALVLGAPQLRG
jgi:hypothetical protein